MTANTELRQSEGPALAGHPRGRVLVAAAARIASAHSELATLQGNAVHSTPELTGTHGTSQPSASLVRASATTRDIPGRRVA